MLVNPTPTPSPIIVQVYNGNDFGTELWANIIGGVITGILAGGALLWFQLWLQGRDETARALVAWIPLKRRLQGLFARPLEFSAAVLNPYPGPIGDLLTVTEGVPLRRWAKRTKNQSIKALDDLLVVTDTRATYIRGLDPVIESEVAKCPVWAVKHSYRILVTASLYDRVGDVSITGSPALDQNYRQYFIATGFVFNPVVKDALRQHDSALAAAWDNAASFVASRVVKTDPTAMP